MKLVSMTCGYIEDMAHRHMVLIFESHKGVHHSEWIDMHHRMALLHITLAEVVAMEVDQMSEAPPTFDLQFLDAHPH
ncbi:hypothetical protein AHAS_Ahas11G0191500 [Arachis hypogaea]